MNFFIKQNSTLPELKFPLTQKIMEKYSITKDMLENVAVTFSMTDAETGLYKIANTTADIVFNNELPEYPYEEPYTLVYRFKLRDTNKAGRFEGEFKIDFIFPENYCGKLTLPSDYDVINIIISPSITKTSV
jgi:hypothetical protein